MKSLFAKTDKSVFFLKKHILFPVFFSYFWRWSVVWFEINWNAEWKNMISDLFLQINSSYVTHDEE